MGAWVRLYNRSTLKAFWEIHANAEEPLRRWYKEVETAKWSSPTDIKAAYASASFVGSDKVVFNIGGNNYRIICRLDYQYKVVRIHFLGTHAEYDDVDVTKA